MSGDVAKPGELLLFHRRQQGLLLSSNGIHLLSQNAEVIKNQICIYVLAAQP